jgi:hypothetical protein
MTFSTNQGRLLTYTCTWMRWRRRTTCRRPGTWRQHCRWRCRWSPLLVTSHHPLLRNPRCTSACHVTRTSNRKSSSDLETWKAAEDTGALYDIMTQWRHCCSIKRCVNLLPWQQQQQDLPTHAGMVLMLHCLDDVIHVTLMTSEPSLNV